MQAKIPTKQIKIIASAAAAAAAAVAASRPNLYKKLWYHSTHARAE